MLFDEHGAPSLAAAALLLVACVTPPPKKPAPPPAKPEIETIEALAFEAEREINAAEATLDDMKPEVAAEHLDGAERALANEKIEAYPEAALLRTRYGELRERLPKVQEEVERRKLAEAVRSARAKIDDAMKTLKGAVQNVARRNPDDVDLRVADERLAAAAAALDEADELEARDRDYSKYALERRKQLDGYKKRVQTRRFEVEVKRSEAELADLMKALASAIRQIRGKDTTDGELDAAKSAADAAGAALSKSMTLAERDPKLGRRLAATQKRLDAQKDLIERRRREVIAARERAQLALAIAEKRAQIDVERSSLSEALKRLRSPDPLEGEWKAAKDQIAAVEKVLDGAQELAIKDRRFSKYVLDARRSLQSSRGFVGKRELEVAVRRQRSAVANEVQNVKITVGDLSTFSPTEAHFKAAEEAVAKAGAALEAGVDLEVKVVAYRKQAADARKLVRTAQSRIAQRKREIEIRERTLLVEDALAAAQGSVKSAKGPDATLKDVEEAVTVVAAVKKELDAGATLETSDRKYAKLASSARRQLKTMEDELAAVKHAAAFRDGAVTMLAGARELLGTARGAEPVEQKKAYAAAIEKLKRCREAGASVLAAYPRLAGDRFAVGGGKPQPAKVILTECAKTMQEAEAASKSVEATAAVYEGPIAALLEAKAHMDAGEAASDPAARRKAYADALGPLGRCIEEGKILQHRHPELAKEQFDVDGKRAPLSTIVGACQKGAETAKAIVAEKT